MNWRKFWLWAGLLLLGVPWIVLMLWPVPEFADLDFVDADLDCE